MFSVKYRARIECNRKQCSTGDRTVAMEKELLAALS